MKHTFSPAKFVCYPELHVGPQDITVFDDGNTSYKAGYAWDGTQFFVWENRPNVKDLAREVVECQGLFEIADGVIKKNHSRYATTAYQNARLRLREAEKAWQAALCQPAFVQVRENRNTGFLFGSLDTVTTGEPRAIFTLVGKEPTDAMWSSQIGEDDGAIFVVFNRLGTTGTPGAKPLETDIPRLGKLVATASPEESDNGHNDDNIEPLKVGEVKSAVVDLSTLPGMGDKALEDATMPLSHTRKAAKAAAA